jgi:two-component system response regulator YesN
MAKLLIVDDEEIIRRGIVAKLKHCRFAFDRIAEAADGREALAILVSERFDIVITDIRMPGMDGIELISAIRRLDMKTRIVIISGFAEFEYAKRAIQLGVDAYLLKPIGETDLGETMAKVLEALDRESRLSEITASKAKLEEDTLRLQAEKKLNRLFHGAEDGAALASAGEWLRAGEDAGAFVAGIVAVDGRAPAGDAAGAEDPAAIRPTVQSLLETVEFAGVRLVASNYKDESQTLVLLAHGDADALKRDAGRYFARAFEALRELGVSCTIGVGAVQPALSHRLFTQAAEALGRRFIQGGNRVYLHDDRSGGRAEGANLPYSLLKLLQSHIERREPEQIGTVLRSVFSRQFIEAGSPAYVRMVWLEIINILMHVGKDAGHESVAVLDNALRNNIESHFKSIDEIVSFTYTTIVDFMDLDRADSFNSAQKARQAMQYIDAHFHEDLTLIGLAYKFAMSPSYFSTIFKKESGQTVVNYITEVRIRNACKSLAETRSGVADIAMSVGYSDVQYFFRVFKKVTGQTPLEYRNGAKGR